jgi:PHD/YefM family antitoxin component YafN of YafNO toxin-antitoxin module
MRKTSNAVHANILTTKDGKKAFAVLPYDEFVAMQEMVEDARDLLSLRRAKKKERNSATVTLQEAKAILSR